MKITLQNLTMQSDFFILTKYPHMVYILLTDIPLKGIRIMKNLFSVISIFYISREDSL